jgi:DNA polymerase III alpha subunit
LADTYGLMVTQDDILAVAHELAGCSSLEADLIRRKVSKPPTAQAGADLLREACGRAGISQEVIEEVCSQVIKFQKESFCKSHAVSYALIALAGLSLKANHPATFWTSVLNNMENNYPWWVYCEAMKWGGVQPSLPCINRSNKLWSPEGNECRCGLEGIAGLTEAVVDGLLEERKRGPYKSLADLRIRVTMSDSELGRLILTGACDFTGRSRVALLREAGFNPEARPKPAAWIPPWPVEGTPARYPLCPRWTMEWPVLGWLSGPSLGRVVRASLSADGLPNSLALPALVGRSVRMIGLLVLCKEVDTEGGEMRFVTLLDEEGLFEAVVLPRCETPDLHGIGPWLVEGHVQEQHGVASIRARRIERAVPGLSLEPAAETASTNGPGSRHTGPPVLRVVRDGEVDEDRA